MKEIKELRGQRNKAARQLCEKQKAQGLTMTLKAAIPNRKSKYKTVGEEQKARQDAATEQVKIFRATLPVLLKRLSKIKDPRNPRKIKHKHTLLIIYGILTFVYHMSSRRQANRPPARRAYVSERK